MINIANFKSDFESFYQNIKDEKSLFRYTKKINLNKIDLPLNHKSKNIFYISYKNNDFYFGLGECIKHQISSRNGLLGLKDNSVNIIDYGNNPNIPIQYFGGAAFDLKSTFNNPWKNIPKGKFTIPKILISKKNNALFISIYILNNQSKSFQNIINEYLELFKILVPKKNKSCNNTKIHEQNNYPNKKEYSDIFNYYINEIKNKKYNKIILSRLKHMVTNKDLNFKQIFKNTDKNCTNFLFSLNNKYFIGSTPENLIDINNNLFTSEAIAGTYKKENKEDIKEAIKKKFLSDKKELEEHKYVSNYIYNTLKKYSNKISISEHPEILELKNLYHLKTSIKGKLNKRNHILDIVNKLYPTPAVSGYPKEYALKSIRLKEKKSRGWYSGCIGWFDINGNGRFDVSIRSGLIDNKNIYLYSGSGLIENSILNNEWLETEMKFKHLLNTITN